ncbi:glutamine amidotransferase [Geovibrio thiophilus]|uniref:Glutamine amidotransferase n=1 Tax=Geovibrio thiophilus TaxID=139438 RepID=A0A3R5Y639_9BACT|nr:glutamine amidotransferase [Geovibrio thiophilus]QAR32556.1 glutamine amidotransferase [Geovibrio thiophilus]
MFLVLKMGSTLRELEDNYGGFADWIIRFMGAFRKQVKVIDVQNGDELPDPSDYEGIVISGAHEMVTDLHPWSEKTAAYLKKAAEKEVPILGICYGHQLLAHALGGRVDNHPFGPEIGTVEIELTEAGKKDPLFKTMPKKFIAHATHTQSVLKLPEGCVILAQNGYEPFHAFRYGKNAWGVQFHPEFDSFIMEQYAEHQKHKLKEPDKTMSLIAETPEANSLLAAFMEMFTKD